MTARKKIRRSEALLGFEAISIEGGLLSPDWLSRAAQLTAGGQSEADYRIPKGLNLRDEIGRYWRIAQAHWSEFAAGLSGAADPRALAEKFVLALLHDALGFASLAPTGPVVIAERTYPIGFQALGGRVPVVIGPASTGLDTPSPAFSDDGRRRSPFGLAQEHLNAADGALWGVACDGVNLRILRDNVSLTRPAWIEADLARIFGEERYADFAALWLLAHETRFGRPDQPVTECALETWRSAGREEGTRAREHLRRGVEEALIALGQGFLAHPDNQPLRASFQNGSLSTKDYFNQLLRLVYRFIFLLTVEERGLLHPGGTSEAIRALYAGGYGLKRLRERSVKRSAHDRFSDLWEATKIVFQGVAIGEPRLGLPALAGIFAKNQCLALDGAKLENRALLLGVFRLSWLRESAGLARVNWRDMGPEELGSVYESLLELVPQLTKDGRHFAFASGGETKGNARKTTGSYYTPDNLVQVLLDSALEPVVAETIAKNPDRPVDALLALSIVDPACGSGHFLLAAARRLAAHVARLQANGTPSAAEYRHALRQVVGRCIYGVDLNPMAVELCKVSLWMEAVEPGLPLTFLNSHIQHGNALLGTTPQLMAGGIPDIAFEAIEGDDNKVASALKKRNKAARAGQGSLEFSRGAEGGTVDLVHAVQALDVASDADLGGLERKELTWRALLDSQIFLAKRLAADTWCAAFVWNKQLGPSSDLTPTNDVFRSIQCDPAKARPSFVAEVRRLTDEYVFFHWHLAFPQVFALGGFDIVLGNPPWERVKLQEQEFFASRSSAISDTTNAAARKKLIATLPKDDPLLWEDWCAASRRAEGESHIIRHSGRYPLCGKGDVNTYAIFAEHNWSVLGPRGRAGFIVPSGIATDDTTKGYFQSITRSRALRTMWEFENEGFFTAGKGHMLRFALTTLSGSDAPANSADFLFQGQAIGDISDHDRHFSLDAKDIATINPNTGTCPIFRTKRDASITLELYKRAGVLWRESDPEDNRWGLRFMAMFHMANDSTLFRTHGALSSEGWTLEGNRFAKSGKIMLPLYEAKMAYQYNHRSGTYEGAEPGDRPHRLQPPSPEERSDPNYGPMPFYWVADAEVSAKLNGVWDRSWLLGWRDVTDARASVRTVVTCILPRVGVGHKMPLAFPSTSAHLVAGLYANLNSLALDYAARQKVGGLSLTYFIVKQLPVIAPAAFSAPCEWHEGLSVHDWLLPRVVELTYTTWDLQGFAQDCGIDGSPYIWDPERRFLIQCEVDAAFFLIYGLVRQDVEYILETFPVLARAEVRTYGEFRTRRVILEIYDAMADAARTGKPYPTRLDPRPADPSVAHAPRSGGKVIPLPVKVRPQPEVRPAVPAVAAMAVPALAAVASNEWARPHTLERGEIQAAILAVLKTHGAPMERGRARFAALLCLEPHLLVFQLNKTERANWTRVVGDDAKKATNASVEATTLEWGTALSGLRARERLNEDLQQNTWAIGKDVSAIDTSGWADGRAGFVVNVLLRLQKSADIDTIIVKLPAPIRQWLKHAA